MMAFNWPFSVRSMMSALIWPFSVLSIVTVAPPSGVASPDGLRGRGAFGRVCSRALYKFSALEGEIVSTVAKMQSKSIHGLGSVLVGTTTVTTRWERAGMASIVHNRAHPAPVQVRIDSSGIHTYPCIDRYSLPAC